MIAFERRFVPIGTFFFRHRNWAFPVLVAGFFLITAPPSTVFGSEALEGATDCAAVLFSFAGLTLRALVIGHDYVSRAGEAKAVHASRLLTRGMFALCRNPLYTGNILIFLGFFLMHGNPWTLVLGWTSYVFIYRAIVAAEEDYLHATFGAAYDAYCASTPRWIPNLLRLPEATRGQAFDFRAVLLVEYPDDRHYDHCARPRPILRGTLRARSQRSVSCLSRRDHRGRGRLGRGRPPDQEAAMGRGRMKRPAGETQDPQG